MTDLIYFYLPNLLQQESFYYIDLNDNFTSHFHLSRIQLPLKTTLYPNGKLPNSYIFVIYMDMFDVIGKYQNRLPLNCKNITLTYV